MQENNKLVQEALIQMRQVEEAIAENAKGILASTMKEEINQLVKESLSEQDEDEVELDVDMDDDDMDVDVDVDTDYEDDDVDMDFDMDTDSEESPIDLTDASDEEILKVFKAMGEDDGIIVKKDGNDIHLTDSDSDEEYLVKLGESEEDTYYDGDMNLDEMDVDTEDVINAIFSKDGDASDIEVDLDDEDLEEDVMYEIEFEDDDSDLEGDDDLNEDDGDFEGDDDLNEDDSDFEGDDDLNEDDSDFEGDDDLNEDDGDFEGGMDESYNRRRTVREAKSTIKGVGVSSGPKFTYKDKAAGGFKTVKKSTNPTMGTGKAKFEYKSGANMEGKSKVVKAETKEGQGYKDKEDERLSMKHGKIASKDLKTTKARRDDAGFEKRETKEAARTYGMGSKEGRGLRKGITNNRNYVYGNSGVKVESTQQEVNMLREKNEEYRKALNIFREKLNEVAIFNSNLAYATRLFTEHSTTKKEKINILRRFDDVETLRESKNLYQSIKGELSKPDTKSINESVETRLTKQVSSGSSSTLIESKTYENPQFMRMKDLMSKLG
jgi:hypothetical protein